MNSRSLLLRFCLGFSALIVSGDAMAQQSPQTQEQIQIQSSLQYWLYLPDGYQQDGTKKWPLMLFLHGAGERGKNLDDVKKWGPPKLVEDGESFPFVLVSPQCLAGQRWNIEHLKQLLDQTIANRKIDESRIYLTGLSMGGYGSWAMAAKHPEFFAAVVPICGGGDPRQAAKLLKTPIWAFHGDADRVVPLSESQSMVEAIKSQGGTNVKLTVYEGVDHNSWTQTYSNPELYQWILKQKTSRGQ